MNGPVASDPTPPREPRGRLRGSPLAYLLLGIAGFAVLLTALSYLRWIGGFATSWDLGIYEQALWTTAHGRVFYEAPDFESSGTGSFLQVHSAFVLYALVPLYALLPSPLTLFAVQAALVASAAYPLFLFARDATGASRYALATGLLYLAWAPLVSATLYDFHVEAFLPLEIFALLWAWQRGRYGVGYVIAVVGFLTLEVVPVLVFFVAVYFLLPGPVGLRRFWAWVRRPEGRAARAREALRTGLRSPRVVRTAVLLASSVVAFFLTVLARERWIEQFLGVSPYRGLVGYVAGYSPGSLGLSLSNLGAGTAQKYEYWLIAYGLLAFLPFLAPRALILAVPWTAFTFLNGNTNFVVLGYQYGFLAAVALFPAFALALPVVARIFEGPVRPGADRPDATDTGPVRSPPGPHRPGRAARRWALVALTALLAANLLFGPLDPAMQRAPGLGAGYLLTYTPAAGAAQVEELAALIPRGSNVLATEDLFPYVANGPGAYTLGSDTAYSPYLPFDPQTPPEFVLVSASRATELPAWLTNLLYAPPAYGVRGVVWASSTGAVLLFERGFAGPLTELGPAPGFPAAYAGAALGLTPLGTLGPLPGTPGPEVALSWRGSGNQGPMLSGPSVPLPAGTYSVVVEARSLPYPSGTAVPPAEWVLSLATGAFGADQAPVIYPYSAIPPGTWTALRLTVRFDAPVLDFAVTAAPSDPNDQIAIGSITLTAVPGLPAA